MSKYPDISHHETVTSWDKIKDTCPFIISKATEGTSFVDPTLDSFIKMCESKKIPYWLYTYLKKGNEVAQAKFMVKTCEGKIGKYFVGYVLDVEAGNTASGVKKALDYITGLGEKTMLYTMYAQYAKYKNVINGRPSDCAWWEARYGKNNGKYSEKYPCHKGVDLHQFTSKAKIDGITGYVDLNRPTGTIKESWFKEPLKEDIPYTKITPDSDPEEIEWLQKGLNKNCQAIIDGRMDKLDVDGKFGTLTLIALVLYWNQLGWNLDGTHAGLKTCTALWKNRKK